MGNNIKYYLINSKYTKFYKSLYEFLEKMIEIFPSNSVRHSFTCPLYYLSTVHALCTVGSKSLVTLLRKSYSYNTNTKDSIRRDRSFSRHCTMTGWRAHLTRLTKLRRNIRLLPTGLLCTVCHISACTVYTEENNWVGHYDPLMD